ncbi:MAG: hypothetical protein ACHQDE_06625 [Acidimicrobiia bacterium]
MTTVAAARPASRRSPTLRASPALRAAPPLRVATRRARTGRLGTLLAFTTVFALVSAVVFHVMLAQNQLQLDRLNGQIATEQRLYEQHRLVTSQLSSPERIIHEGERLGLVVPAAAPQTLFVPAAPLPATDTGATATTTLDDWTKAKPSLGSQQP